MKEQFKTTDERLKKRRILVAAAATGMALGGAGVAMGSESAPCDPIIDNGCVIDPENPNEPLPTLPPKEATTVPETTVPETTVPETTVPETTVPQTTVPETTVPQTTVPQTTVPQTTVPQTTVPQTTTTIISRPPNMPPMTTTIPTGESEQTG